MVDIIVGTIDTTPTPTYIDAIRLLLGDIGPDAVLTDAQIATFYTAYGTTYLTASKLAGALKAHYAKMCSKSIGNKSVQLQQIWDHYKQLETDLKDQSDIALGKFVITAPPIDTIDDTLPANFPPRQRLSDILEEEFGTATSQQAVDPDILPNTF